MCSTLTSESTTGIKPFPQNFCSASPESGLCTLHQCPGCGLSDYSPITNPAKVVDKSNWDGTDFFRVNPVSDWIFVTNRVVEALRENIFTGWQAESPGDMQDTFDIAIGRASVKEDRKSTR